MCEGMTGYVTSAAYEKLAAENERLRAALESIFERKSRTALDARIMWDTAARVLAIQTPG